MSQESGIVNLTASVVTRLHPMSEAAMKCKAAQILAKDCVTLVIFSFPSSTFICDGELLLPYGKNAIAIDALMKADVPVDAS